MPAPRAATPTIADVARHAGVSTATVSRCLNAPDTVRAEKRAKVLEAVAELGYRPSAFAKGLATRRSRTIGAVFPRLNSLLFGSVFGALQRRLDAQGYMLLLTATQFDVRVETRQVEALIDRGVDALILVGQEHPEGVFAAIATAGIPALATWVHAPAPRLPQVGFDNAAGMAKVIEHLADMGHRRLGLITAPTSGNDRAAARLAGAREAARRRGIALEPDAIATVPFGLDEAGAAFLRLMGAAVPPTAVVCGSDLHAFGVLREARRAGLAVPADVSVTGFDDTELAACVAPALTTLRTPRETMAERTADALVAHLERGEPLHSLRLETELILRDTTAPPPRAAPAPI